MIGACVVLFELLPVEGRLLTILPCVRSLVEDRAWRVRWCACLKMSELVQAAVFGDANYLANRPGGAAAVKGVNPVTFGDYNAQQRSIAEAFESTVELLLHDGEAEVRSAIANDLHTLCIFFSMKHNVGNILPCIQSLATDSSSEFVRISVATTICSLAPIFGACDSFLAFLCVL